MSSADERRTRARDALHRVERVTQRLGIGLPASLDFFAMSRELLSNDTFGSSAWIAESLALWTSTWSSLMGCEIDNDEGLDFQIDEFTESTGPRYIARPKWMSGSAQPTPRDVKPADNSRGVLDMTNVVVRLEDDRLSVTLVNLRKHQPALLRLDAGKKMLASAAGTPSVRGEYKIVFAEGKTITFRATASARAAK